MKDEIKEILESLDKISKAEYYPEDLLTYKECKLLLDYITNLQERKITKEDVDKYFEENMCLSFDKFIENWNEQEELANYYKKENERWAYKYQHDLTDKQWEIEDYKSRCEKEIERLNNIINELEKDIKNLYTYGIKNNAEQRDYLLNRLDGLRQVKELKEGK